MLQMGTITLGDVPRLALVVRDGAPDDRVRAALNEGANLLELRIDQFAEQGTDHVLAELARWKDIPRLGTIRCAEEGGSWTKSEAERAALYRAILPHVEAVDIELTAATALSGVLSAAQDAGRLVIGSHHDFDKTPARARINELFAQSRDLGADIFKIACHCADENDLRTLAAFLLDHAGDSVIAIGMGAFGAAARIFFPMLGSLIAYTFLDAPSAPGQLNCTQTVQYLNAFYPGRRRTASREDY
jgi:3-dehydroquinate dehydratase-1